MRHVSTCPQSGLPEIGEEWLWDGDPVSKQQSQKRWCKELPPGLPLPQFHSNLADKIIILRSEGEKKAPLSHEEVSSSLSDFVPFA